MIRMSRTRFTVAIALALAAGLVWAQPPSRNVPRALVADADGRCTVAYTLAPGERRVFDCQYKPFRAQPVVQVQSQHADVDTSIISAGLRSASVSLSNRGTAPATGTAVIDVY